ncbi:MAG: DUF3149 domain-containing protein [Burkholderiales bacterium]
MNALKEEFTPGPGLMNATGTAFMLGLGVFFLRYFLNPARRAPPIRRAR